MDEYKVEIKETLNRLVTVDVLDTEDAIDMVRDQYNNEEVVLGASDFDDVKFEVE